MELNEVGVLSVDKLDEIVNEYLKDVKEEKLDDKGWPTHTSAYTISKAAVNAYARIVAKSYPTLLINCVCPGFVKTDMTCNKMVSLLSKWVPKALLCWLCFQMGDLLASFSKGWRHQPFENY